jgi:ribosomal protein L7Ae-like RNA K-turn-binding protein
MSDYVYMKITKDKYELPVAVAESTTELAKICGLKNSGSVRSMINEPIRLGFRPTYIKVEVSEDD